MATMNDFPRETEEIIGNVLDDITRIYGSESDEMNEFGGNVLHATAATPYFLLFHKLSPEIQDILNKHKRKLEQELGFEIEWD